eukprot:TRINITY_DN3511_c2_g1_i1.p1 TRINITY_DN3511_c2_g1~~TRINITY_DN3511_c2_g1_i1.p1  ORF type:complete len:338 (+),score=108.04 TRINITY_DN3511_c2_g1_i1:122-1135(+)
MSAGNPMGLSEISHFGQFKGVGGKAGGFISKKFFHPSSFKNQEKLWKAQTEDERERRKQIELEKRREEERQVEELRKQMYLAGQGTKGDFISTAAQEKAALSHLSDGQISQQRTALEEMRKRKLQLKQQKQKQAALAEAAQKGEDDSEEDDAEEVVPGKDAKERVLAKSRYREDHYIQGHKEIWGSWYNTENKQWGFKCCKIEETKTRCPIAEAEEAEEAAKAKDEPKGKRRRRGKAALDGGAASPLSGGDASPATGSPAEEEDEGGLQIGGQRQAQKQNESVDPASLLDTRMFAAAAARKQSTEKIKFGLNAQEPTKSDSKESGYLADLLGDPTAP